MSPLVKRSSFSFKAPNAPHYIPIEGFQLTFSVAGSLMPQRHRCARPGVHKPHVLCPTQASLAWGDSAEPTVLYVQVTTSTCTPMMQIFPSFANQRMNVARAKTTSSD